MGRIKTQLIKRTSHKILERHPNELTEDFAKNKVLVNQFADIQSKKIVNSITGYVTRLVKMNKKKAM